MEVLLLPETSVDSHCSTLRFVSQERTLHTFEAYSIKNRFTNLLSHIHVSEVFFPLKVSKMQLYTHLQLSRACYIPTFIILQKFITLTVYWKRQGRFCFEEVPRHVEMCGEGGNNSMYSYLRHWIGWLVCHTPLSSCPRRSIPQSSEQQAGSKP
jgi:hypothetical protein